MGSNRSVLLEYTPEPGWADILRHYRCENCADSKVYRLSWKEMVVDDRYYRHFMEMMMVTARSQNMSVIESFVGADDEG